MLFVVASSAFGNYGLGFMVRHVLLFSLAAAATLHGAVPLTVKDGKFYRNGQPYRGIGINYYDAFLCELEKAPSASGASPRYVEGLEFLSWTKIPFARVAACPFYPLGWRTYQEQPDRYFAILDGLVKEAERQGVGLIPSFFWAYFAVPDLMGESISAWGDPSSKTRTFMRDYTRKVVSRYRNSPAIWAWEFGNEYLSEADLPGPMDSEKWVVTKQGTAARRTEADRLPSRGVIDACREFACIVREIDTERPIMTGDAAPRVSAWNLARGQGWKADSPAQWQEALAEANPDPMDTLSLHFYHPRADATGYAGYGISGASVPEILARANETAQRVGKPLWLGEFGPGIGETDPEQRRKQVSEFLNWITKGGVSLSAYWVFNSTNPDLSVWNALPDGENAFVFEMIAEANRRLAAQSHLAK